MFQPGRKHHQDFRSSSLMGNRVFMELMNDLIATAEAGSLAKPKP
jgi:hypothetical protein